MQVADIENTAYHEGGEGNLGNEKIGNFPPRWRERVPPVVGGYQRGRREQCRVEQHTVSVCIKSGDDEQEGGEDDAQHLIYMGSLF